MLFLILGREKKERRVIFERFQGFPVSFRVIDAEDTITLCVYM
jgi:hypothetical protein